MDSDIPSQTIGKQCRAGDLRAALVAEKEVAKEHAHWRHYATKGEIGVQPRKEPAAPSVMVGGGSALSAWVAEEHNRYSGQKLPGEEECLHADPENKARGRELDARKQFKVFRPAKMSTQTKEIAEPRWALTRNEVGGKETAKTRLVAKG